MLVRPIVRSKKRDLLAVSFDFVRRFQIEGKIPKGWMVDDSRKRFDAERSVADFLVAVLMAPKGVLAVVDMNGAKMRQSDDPIQFIKHIVQPFGNIVTRVINVASIEADAEAFASRRLIHNRANLLESRSDFAAYSGHRLEENRRMTFLFEEHGKRFRDCPDAFLDPLTDMAPRMEIIHGSRNDAQSTQVVRRAT